jgi:hypothetical protein
MELAIFAECWCGILPFAIFRWFAAKSAKASLVIAMCLGLARFAQMHIGIKTVAEANPERW